MYIISTGLLNSNLCHLTGTLFCYTDLRITEDYHSLYLTFIGSTNESITGYSLENCEFDSSIAEEMMDEEYVTRLEVILKDNSKFTYKDFVWVSTVRENTRYVYMPNGKIISYDEENGFLDEVEDVNHKP
jgi:hypothetical protein